RVLRADGGDCRRHRLLHLSRVPARADGTVAGADPGRFAVGGDGVRARPLLIRTLMIAAALFCASCSAGLGFRECNVDTDCVGTTDAGTKLYCSDDHMCVGAIPDYLLCHVDVPADGNIPSGALVIGGLYRTSGANDVNDHAFRNAANLAAGEFRG